MFCLFADFGSIGAGISWPGLRGRAAPYAATSKKLNGRTGHFPSMKSYGRVDSSWDKAKVRKVLEDASAMAKEHSMPFCVCEDTDENVAIVPNQGDEPVHIFVCGVTNRTVSDHQKKSRSQAEIKETSGGEFWDNAEYHRYTIDEMVPRAHSCLVNGIIGYGHLGFLSEGRMQLARVLNDAKKMAERHSRPFIAGQSKEGGIMIAPLSEGSRFFAPLSCVVARSGFWTVSDMHSDRILPPHSCIVTTTETDSLARLDNTGPLFMLYEGIAYGRKHYGGFKAGRDSRVLDLESALEDAARMSRHRGVSHGIFLDGSGSIRVERSNDSEDHTCDAFLEVDPKEYFDGDLLLREKIGAAARAACERLSRVRKDN